MDLVHKPHFRTTSTGHSTTTTNEPLIGFASRRSSSSSSMKLTRSILSPGRAARDGAVAAGGPVSLSSSLSRRLRSNGSLKGRASPFLAGKGKRRSGGFENPEPSSPKVTCIGQVRVKTKKKVKQTRSLSKMRAGDISFRKTEQQTAVDNNGGDVVQVRYSNAGGAHYYNLPAQECLPHRNQRWVHLPISICDALREFSCLFPCKSSCFSRDRAEERRPGADEAGCGSVIARWLVSVNDGEGGRRREIELVVGGGDEDTAETTKAEEARVSIRSSRRHVFDDIEVRDDKIEINGQSVDDEVENARVSICIPPKNALLLMRCRSDPMKMASLAGRFSWDPKRACKNDSESSDEIMDEVLEKQDELQGCEGKDEVFEQKVDVLGRNSEEHGKIRDETDEVTSELFMEAENMEEIMEDELEENSEASIGEKGRDDAALEKEILCNEGTKVEKEDENEEETESNMSSFEALLDDESIAEHYEDSSIVEDQEEEEAAKESSSVCRSSPTTETDTEINQTLPILESEEHEVDSGAIAGKDPTFADEDSEESRVTSARIKQPDLDTTQHEKEEQSSEMEESVTRKSFEESKKDKGSPTLPECLLLMMCEPKLSMEVSKETWVCTTDFVRGQLERPRRAAAVPAVKPADSDATRLSVKFRSVSNKPPAGNGGELWQPPRSSCSLPAATAAASMAAVIEQKLANAVGYEPYVLTRCKSEPMRTAAAKLMPESCFWKNAVRKMEPHRRAAVGVAAGGVGF